MFGEENFTTGASGDIKSATSIARDMIEVYGMSEKLGLVDLRNTKDGLAEATRKDVDLETRTLIGNAQKEAARLLTEHRGVLDRLAHALLESETLDGGAVRQIVRSASSSVAAMVAPR